MRWAAWVLLLPLAAPAQAHEWYAPSCCSGHDCLPLTESQVREMPGGWMTPAGLVGYTDERIKPSQDGRFHLCAVDQTTYIPGQPSTTTRKTVIRCLYVPPRGF